MVSSISLIWTHYVLTVSLHYKFVAILVSNILVKHFRRVKEHQKALWQMQEISNNSEGQGRRIFAFLHEEAFLFLFSIYPYLVPRINNDDMN